MGGERKALIVANDEYEHDALRRLKAPAADARALARVLGDRDIGGFGVDVVLNESAHEIEARIEDLFADSQSDDLLLLHFSCHGLKSEAGELFFAARNTRPDRLGSTAIPADFIQRCIRSCRARSIVLLLDCCYGGAFGQGVTVRASGSANVLESFPAGKLGGGKGRAVITASSSMEYAFEGNELADNHQQQPSLFTSALVEGLESGEADRDEDGLISLNELYEYVFDKVREENPNQTPSRDVEMQGELYVARSRRKRVRPVPIPAEVQAALVDPNMFTRLGAVSELRARLNSADIGAALGAHAALLDLSRTDIKYVGDAAAEALAGVAIRVVEKELSFGVVEPGATPDPLALHLLGPPLARACTFSSSEEWVRIQEAAEGPRVSVDTSVEGRLRGSLTVKGLTGEAVVQVSVDVVPAAVVVEPEPIALEPEPIALEPKPVALEPKPVALAPQPVVVPVPVDVKPEPVEVPVPVDVAPVPVDVAPEPVGVRTAHVGIRPDRVTPTQPRDGSLPRVAAARTGSGSGRLRLAGQVAVVAGALMTVGAFLPFQYDAPMIQKAQYVAWYLLLVGVLAVAGGIWTAFSPTGSWVGPGLVLGGAALPTWGIPHLINAWVEGDADGFNFGYPLEIIAQLLLVAAGCLVVAALARLDEVHIRGLSRSDRLEWLIVVLAVAGGLIIFAEGAAGWANSIWYGVQTIWVTVLAIALPAAAVLVLPRRLGVSLLAGWLVSGLALTVAYRLWLHHYGYEAPKIDAFFVSLLVLAAATAVWGARQSKAS